MPPARAETATATQQVEAQLAPKAKLSTPADITFVGVGQTFLPFVASMPVNYRARSTPGGTGSITMEVSADFSPPGGPSVDTGALRYRCIGATLGQGCSGFPAAGRTGTPVLQIPPSACTGGGGPCSGADPNTLQIEFTLENNPAYQTGIYSARITLTISSI